MKEDASFGVIPLSKGEGKWKVFLVQHKHARYWGFPKGHPEPGESPLQTAVRELKEETNLDIVRYLQEEPLTEEYRFTFDSRRIHKRVFYYVAEVEGEIALQNKEIEDGKWVSFPEAIDQVTHQEGKSILQQVVKILAKM